MKLLWRLSREAIRHKYLYLVAIMSTLALTIVNLTAPKILSDVVGIIEQGMEKEDLGSIKVFTSILIVLYLFRVLFRYLSNYLAHKAAWNLVGDLRVKIYHKLQNLSMSFFHDKQTGDLVSRVINDTRDFELLYAHIIPDTITNIVMIVGVITILLFINSTLALLIFIPIPMILLSGWIFTKKIQPFFKKSHAMEGALSAKLQDNLSGIHEIQVFVKETEEKEQVRKTVFEHINAMLQALQYSAVFHPTVEFLSAVGTILVIGAGGVLSYHKQLTVADIVAFLLYLSLFYTPVTSIARLLEEAQQAYAGAERVMMILDTESEIREAEDALRLDKAEGNITFEHVGFHYKNGIPVLKDISYEGKAGQMIALVGETGVGKTTLSSLILRFYDPTEGRILIDGVDITKLKLESLRKNIAPVLQDTFLFNGTIAENIGYASANATREEIIEAAKAAHIHEAILEMPEGYETKVGERGLRLSGGQKQRVAIARAILRKAPIIILDEATASVDVETEKEIKKAIDELAGKKTIVAIAHRLSTIRHADMILVLENGEIVERGTHEELLEIQGIYYRMIKVQL